VSEQQLFRGVKELRMGHKGKQGYLSKLGKSQLNSSVKPERDVILGRISYS